MAGAHRPAAAVSELRPALGGRFHAWRIPFVAAALLAMMYGAWLGLVRLGWDLPVLAYDQLGSHGPLMVCGFLGTLIATERAVALGAPWGYLGPLLTAAGAALLLADAGVGPAAAAISSGSLIVVAVFALLLRRQASLFLTTMAVGAVAWTIGNAWWLAGAPVRRVVYWWIAFLVLTIAGERLELNRVLRPTRSVLALFAAPLVVLLAGVAATAWAPVAGVRVAGAGLVGVACWLARYDVARRTIRTPGLTRYMAICLLCGYVWLGIAGVFAIVSAPDFLYAGLAYDASLHAVFLGFAMSMVFGHAPVIFPAVLGLPIRYGRSFYAHLIVLHASIALRVAGDAIESLERWRSWGGLLNGVALVLFVAATLGSVVRSLAPQRPVRVGLD